MEKPVIGSKEEDKGQMSRKDKAQKKRKKNKSKDHGGDGDRSIQSDERNHILDMEKAEVSAEMAENSCLEHAEGSNEEDKGQMSKKDKAQKKRKKDKSKGHGGDGDRSIQSGERNHIFDMEKAEVSAEMAEKPCLEHAEGIITKSDVKKDRKKKRKDKEADTIIQKQIHDANDDSIGSESVERNKGEGEQDIKSKKRKQKHQGGETSSNASSGDQIVSGGDKKMKRKDLSVTMVTMEEGNGVDISQLGQNTKGKKKKRKERDNVGVDLSQNTPAVDGKNSNKDKKPSKDENDGGKRKKVNSPHRKGKGKQVSFTDDVEVFNIDGGDDGKGDGSSDDGLVHGRRFSCEEDAKLMEAIVQYAELRDNISWEAISEKLTTRSNKDCCLKWYQQLASPLVKEGTWADTDDYLLMEALQKVDAVCVEDVDWERLLDHRSGELCRRRWNQTVRMLGGYREKPFIEQVEVLAKRYSPEMLDYRKPEASNLFPDELAEESD
nr:unnamed protein product [Digitaria exilis]